MSILLFGGSFDPFHNGHLNILKHLCTAFPALTAIELLPTPQNPQKGLSLAKKHRYLMLIRVLETEFNTQSSPPIRINTFELERQPPIYTIDTLRQLRQRGYPALQWVMGSDQFEQFHTWKSPLSILSLLEKLILIDRPGYHSLPPLTIPDHLAPKITPLHLAPCSISSQKIRQLCLEKKSISKWVPACISSYIKKNNLYLEIPA